MPCEYYTRCIYIIYVLLYRWTIQTKQTVDSVIDYRVIETERVHVIFACVCKLFASADGNRISLWTPTFSNVRNVFCHQVSSNRIHRSTPCGVLEIRSATNMVFGGRTIPRARGDWLPAQRTRRAATVATTVGNTSIYYLPWLRLADRPTDGRTGRGKRPSEDGWFLLKYSPVRGSHARRRSFPLPVTCS